MNRASSALMLTAVMCLSEVLGMTGFAMFPALQPGFMAEWGLSNTDAGWINGIYYAGYVVAVAVLTSLTDRMPARKIYYLCMAITGISSLGYAYLAEGFWTALAFRTLAGIGLAGTYMPGLKLLTDHIKDLGHGRSVAFYTASFGIGSSLSYFLSGVIAAAFTWQEAFLAAGIGPLLAMALIYFVFPHEDPDTGAAPDTHLLDFRPVLKCREAMGYVLAYTAHNFELFAYRSWIVSFLVFSWGLQPGGGPGWRATTVAAVINLTAVPSSILGNELTRRFARRKVVFTVMVTSAVFAAFIGFTAAWPVWLLTLLCLLYGLTVMGESASVTTGLVQAAPDGYRGAALAVHSCIGFTGSFLGPLAFGVMLDLTGAGHSVFSWGMAFAMTGAVLLLGPLSLFLLTRAARPAEE
ncbi:MAG: MFS transporter [Rhodospirillales bacterium]|nr:MFS transporter [Rhodospirillales bacterium]